MTFSSATVDESTESHKVSPLLQIEAPNLMTLELKINHGKFEINAEVEGLHIKLFKLHESLQFLQLIKRTH